MPCKILVKFFVCTLEFLLGGRDVFVKVMVVIIYSNLVAEESQNIPKRVSVCMMCISNFRKMQFFKMQV